MKDSGPGEMDCFVAPRAKPKKASVAGQVALGGALALFLVVFAFSIGLLASHCEHPFRPAAELLQAEHMVSEAAHELVVRGEGGGKGIVFRSVADAMAGSSGLGTVTVTATAFKSVGTAGTAQAAMMQPGTARQVPWAPSGQSTAKDTQLEHSQTISYDAAPVGVSVPISTHTELSTIYSIRGTVNTTVHLTVTRTATTTMTRPVSSTKIADVCSAGVSTKTVSVYVTVAPLPDKTVTGDASTATEVNTDLSRTTRLPDVTLPGKPSTQTAVQTDVSLTRGLPDATVSGSPETQTNVRTDVSVTAGLPDATVSGSPETVTSFETSAIVTSKTATAVHTVVISDLWATARSSRRTLTATVTKEETVATTEGTAVTTITISNLYGPPAKSSGSSSALADAATGPASGAGAPATETVTVTRTGGPPATSMTTVHITLAQNTTIAGYYPTGSAAATAPVQVSEGNGRPQARGWGGGGSVNLSCTVMLVAAIMFAL